MFESKILTDNEIAKAVNYCAKVKSIEDCDKCPARMICDDSNDERLISGVSNLINRLQKENKEKDEMLKAQADTIFLYERVIKDKNVAIERLKDKLFLALHTDTAADCKAYGQDCTAEDCASCLADHILADGWIRPKLKEEAEQALKCDKTKEWLHSDIDDLIDMDYVD